MSFDSGQFALAAGLWPFSAFGRQRRRAGFSRLQPGFCHRLSPTFFGFAYTHGDAEAQKILRVSETAA
jgi:hypothetical protein